MPSDGVRQPAFHHLRRVALLLPGPGGVCAAEAVLSAGFKQVHPAGGDGQAAAARGRARRGSCVGEDGRLPPGHWQGKPLCVCACVRVCACACVSHMLYILHQCNLMQFVLVKYNNNKYNNCYFL